MLAPARLRPPRAQTESQKPAPVQVRSFTAPVAGLVTNETMPTSNSAIVLENVWPTREGVELRKGSTEQCTTADAIVTLFQHRGAGDYFAATETAIYPFDGSSVGALAASVTGLTSGEWVTYEVQNSGGNYLLCVNGFDSLRRYDGSSWLTITGSGTGAITGVDTSALSYVWGHRNRVFFIQGGTLSAWYLATNAIAGAATELPLTAVFRKGGSLLMGGTWSSDSGAGMDDRCIFITDRGEVAIYAGSNPGDVNNWSLQGVYDVGVPLGRFSMEVIGGDVVILTRDGIVPLSAVVSKDPSQLSGAAISAQIAPTLRADMEYRPGSWRISKWDVGGMLLVAPMVASDVPVNIYAANLETGAWSVFTGWEASDIRSLGNALYFGTRDGSIRRAWTGGDDNGYPFYAKIMLAPDGLGDLASTKSVGTIQAVFKARANLSYSMGVAVNYSQKFGTPPASSSVAADEDGSEWDVAEWDLASWGTDTFEYFIVSGWRGTSGVGFAFSPWVQVLSDSSAWINAKLQRIDLTFVPAGVQL